MFFKILPSKGQGLVFSNGYFMEDRFHTLEKLEN